MPEPTIERVQVVFRGRVQRVGFRATTRDAANGRDVTGWVRNEIDGSVCCQIQGSREEIAAVLRDVRSRMQGLITAESSIPAPVEPDESGFEIRF